MLAGLYCAFSHLLTSALDLFLFVLTFCAQHSCQIQLNAIRRCLLFYDTYLLTLQSCKYDGNIKWLKFSVYYYSDSHMKGWMGSMSLVLWFTTSTRWFCAFTSGWILLGFFACSNFNISDKLIYLLHSFHCSAYFQDLTPCISFILRSIPIILSSRRKWWHANIVTVKDIDV